MLALIRSVTSSRVGFAALGIFALSVNAVANPISDGSLDSSKHLAAEVPASIAATGNLTPEACQADKNEDCIGAATYFEHQSNAQLLSERLPGVVTPPARLSIGLALAGGGTRASQFAIGILQGLHESGLLNDVTFLSTVSGGGYAGYWYMTQRIDGANADDLFRDCIPYRYQETAKRLGYELHACKVDDAVQGVPCLCPELPTSPKDDGGREKNRSAVIFDEPTGRYTDPYRFQNNLRTHPDLFAPNFNEAVTGSDSRFLLTALPQAVMQLALSGTVDLVGDVMFDWNFNNSTSRLMYRDGIQRVYGQPPVDCARVLNSVAPWRLDTASQHCLMTRDLVDELPEEFQSLLMPSGQSVTKPEPITFVRLAEEWRSPQAGASSVPYWIINATTPVLNCPKVEDEKPCLISEVFSDASYPPHKAAFEFTPDRWGAGEFGYWRVDVEHKPFGTRIDTVLDAVASSAAFFDPNQRSFMAGGLINALLQISGFRWGYYISNPHVGARERGFHRTLPFPLYLFHGWRENKAAVDIHLIDGGQSDNLGAYTLIRRRVPNIILSDHAGETRSGNMEDICQLRKSLALKEFAEWNHNRIWRIQFDDLAGLERVCNGRVDLADYPATVPQTEQGYRYNVHAWPHSVLRGCAVELHKDVSARLDPNASCSELREKIERNDGTLRSLNLFLIKPALDLASFTSAPEAPLLRRTAIQSADVKSTVELRGFLENNVGMKEGDGILLFPNHTTVKLTLDSSPFLFGAYRELAARAARRLQIHGGELVVTGPIESPMQPEPDYQVDQKSSHLTQKLSAALRAVTKPPEAKYDVR